MTQTTTVTAAQAYTAAHLQAKQLHERLGKALADHASRAHADPANWCFPADIKHHNGKLIEYLYGLGALTVEERSLHRFR